MNITARSYLTAGIAAVGAGAIALTPVQPMPAHLAVSSERAVSNLAVSLASTIDPITPWVDTIKTSAANIKQLFDFYVEKPFPLIQTIAANQVTYFQELTGGNANLIPEQIWGNVQTFFKAPWSPGDPAGEYISQVPLTDPLGLSQQTVFALLPVILGDAYDQLKPILDFTATPYSGQVVGLVGPLLAPLVVLTRSFTAIGQFFQDGDVVGALNELINIPANVANGVLNGAGYLDLTGVANAIAPLPPEVKNIGLNLGGVISPPVPATGTVDAPTAWNGGVAFDSLAAGISYKISNFPPPNGTSIDVNDPGLPQSWIGSSIGLGQLLGQQMLVTPPAPPAQATKVAAAAAIEAPAIEAPAAAAPEVEASEVEASEVSDVEGPAVEADAPAVDKAVKAPAVAKVAEKVAAALAGPKAAAGKSDDSGAKAQRRGHK